MFTQIFMKDMIFIFLIKNRRMEKAALRGAE
jgi:hypothetical protein